MMNCLIFASDPGAAPNPYPAPTAAFLPDGGFEDNYTVIQFSDQSTGFPTSWTWKINGSVFSIIQNPAYYFSQPGSYEIELTATNDYGSDSVSWTFHID